LPPLVAAADEGYRFDESTGDPETIADINAVVTVNGDYCITADFVRQSICG